MTSVGLLRVLKVSILDKVIFKTFDADPTRQKTDRGIDIKTFRADSYVYHDANRPVLLQKLFFSCNKTLCNRVIFPQRQLTKHCVHKESFIAITKYITKAVSVID